MMNAVPLPAESPTMQNSAATLYQQLADDLSLAISRGTLPPGSRLPSVRRAATAASSASTPWSALTACWKTAA
ncbi:Uncharacterised protein [Chromobacterium violaceum]|uniref:Uncharacterized protein n=1 Tax=Chromobacterium violaceum TaxID=536 RepID=A0A3S4IFC1_CHRVL|nr:Uncharacterised protein [Chromobacterium violaceum]